MKRTTRPCCDGALSSLRSFDQGKHKCAREHYYCAFCGYDNDTDDEQHQDEDDEDETIINKMKVIIGITVIKHPDANRAQSCAQVEASHTFRWNAEQMMRQT
eukprot:3847213-Amphidinium_carterae.1